MNVDINGNLRKFNQWWDAFILEAIKPVAILSMGLGTVAIFNLQGLAISPWFVALWAIVQAASIDGLFFATWDRLFTQKLAWKNALAIFGLTSIGLTLALVAIAINAILGFQVLWSLADSQQAMTRLGISSEWFTVIRAILAVVVFVMISFVRARARANEPGEKAKAKPASSQKEAKSVAKIAISEQPPLAIPEVASSRKYELIKAALAKAYEVSDKPNLTAIAKETGAGYSTVKLHAPKIKKELGV